MLKGTLAAHLPLIFLRLLSSVAGDEGGFSSEGLPYFTSTFKEMCLEHYDPASCQYWDTMRYKINDSDGLKPKSAIEMGSEDRKENREGDIQEEMSFEIPVESDNNLQKRFTVYRRKAPTVRGYKRGPGFRSWGGKRDMTSSGQSIDKKTKFVSWGGKRDRDKFPDDLITSNNDYALDKKTKFQNWGGKRDSNDISGQAEKRGPFFKARGLYFSEPFKKHVPKRPQFQSWGGKRASHLWNDYISFLYSQPRFLLNAGEKRKFSSWGGKRSDEWQNQDWHFNGEDNVKRHVFQNWGGKRETVDEEPNEKESETGELGKERKKREVETNQAGEEHRDGKSGR